jgi:ABC-type antimicrobial peptide transport system permease subunit
MFPGLGLVLLALMVIPILGGVVAGLFFLSVPRLRFLATYSTLVPLFGVSGLVGGFMGGLRLARPFLYRYDYGLSTTVWPAWVLTILVMLIGVAAGITSGVFAGLAINRVARRAAPNEVRRPLGC